MQGQQPVFFAQTLLKVITQALAQVADTKAQKAVILAVSDIYDAPIKITVQYAGGRHGCGDEGTGIWAHTEGVYDGNRFDKAVANGPDLVEPILSYLTKRLEHANVVSGLVSFEPYPGGEPIEAVTSSCAKS